jgi:putative metallohydrolase (TIGR04338 family)
MVPSACAAPAEPRRYRQEWHPGAPLGREFPTLREARAYLHDLLDDPGFRGAYPDFGHAVRLRRNRARKGRRWESEAFADGRIVLSPHHGRAVGRPDRFFERVLLHEVAHLLAPPPAEAHGPEFGRAYLYLVALRMGPDAARSVVAPAPTA